MYMTCIGLPWTEATIVLKRMLPNAILIANGKGGVGKTSITANLAGTAAGAGWRVLAIDLDPQGNLGSDLGYRQQGRGDAGRSLWRAVRGDGHIEVLESIRPGLDVVAGGSHLRALADDLTVDRQTQATVITALATTLAPLAHGYDLVVIDGPPAGGSLVDAALCAARWVVIPVRGDEGSLDGLELIASAFGSARAHNPHLTLMGIAMFDLAVNATALRDELRATLEAELGTTAPVFGSVIRSSQRSAFDMRRFGLLAKEYHQRSQVALAADRARRRIESDGLGPAVRRFSSAAHGLADDYRLLTAEILDRFVGATS